MYTVLKLFWPFEGNREADEAPSENEFDTPGLGVSQQGWLIAFLSAAFPSPGAELVKEAAGLI